MYFWGVFICQYLLILTRFLGSPKMSGTEEVAEGDSPRVFNCSTVGYPALLAAAVVAQEPSFRFFPGLAKTRFSVNGAQ